MRRLPSSTLAPPSPASGSESRAERRCVASQRDQAPEAFPPRHGGRGYGRWYLRAPGEGAQRGAHSARQPHDLVGDAASLDEEQLGIPRHAVLGRADADCRRRSSSRLEFAFVVPPVSTRGRGLCRGRPWRPKVDQYQKDDLALLVERPHRSFSDLATCGSLPLASSSATVTMGSPGFKQRAVGPAVTALRVLAQSVSRGAHLV